MAENASCGAGRRDRASFSLPSRASAAAPGQAPAAARYLRLRSTNLHSNQRADHEQNRTPSPGSGLSRRCLVLTGRGDSPRPGTRRRLGLRQHRPPLRGGLLRDRGSAPVRLGLRPAPVFRRQLRVRRGRIRYLLGGPGRRMVRRLLGRVLHPSATLLGVRLGLGVPDRVRSVLVDLPLRLVPTLLGTQLRLGVVGGMEFGDLGRPLLSSVGTLHRPRSLGLVLGRLSRRLLGRASVGRRTVESGKVRLRPPGRLRIRRLRIRTGRGRGRLQERPSVRR